MDKKEKKKFYNSKEWKRKRIDILERDRHECQDCRTRLKRANEQGIYLRADDRKIRRATEVHHIKELEEYPGLALDDDNLISLCVMCHNMRHGRTVKEFSKKRKRVSEEKW